MLQKALIFILLTTFFSLQAQQSETDVLTTNDFVRKSNGKKNENNPQIRFQNFTCDSYRKIVVSAEADSIAMLDEALFGKKTKKLNKKLSYFKNLLEEQHLFISEKVSKLQFEKETSIAEKVTKVKMSGLEKPIYEIVAFELQSFSLYDETYVLLETNYKSPFSKKAFENYTFTILDTVQIQNRTVVLVSFKAKKSSQKNQLNGVLYLDLETGAIAKAETVINGFLNIDAIHTFYYNEAEKIWLPVEKTFTFSKGTTMNELKIIDETFGFESNDNDWNQRKDITDFAFLTSKTLFYNYDFNQNSDEKQPQKLIIPQTAVTKSDTFWEEHYGFINNELEKQYPEILILEESKNELKKEATTYQYMDSLVRKQKIEKRIFQGRKVINGYLPVGFFDFDARYLISFNNYEGFRMGIGGVTNELFAKNFRLQGYGAYGLKDNAFKYQAGSGFKINNETNTWVNVSYTDDVREIASNSFLVDKKVFKLIDPRPFNITTFYNYKTWLINTETKLFPKTNSIWQLEQSHINPLFNYEFISQGKSYTEFNFSTLTFSMQWNPFSNFMKTPDGISEMAKKYPQFTIQATQTLPNVLDNDFDFTKIDFKTTYEKKYINGQKSSLLFQAGVAFGDVPLTHLYSISPNNLTKDAILQRITFSGKNSFETMFFNEFFSNEYASLQLKHELNRVKIFNKVKPSLVLVTRMAWGNLNDKENHLGVDFKTLENGFFESGIELNKIYKGIGFTFFYRYGPNQLPRFDDNISVKISYFLDLGF
uniref:DUF5686 family protein n=1 Tax=Flavobacterium sp. TaxID=239 RepID=UPI00404B59BD